MVLESTIICVDNSQFMRNGDFLPTRCVFVKLYYCCQTKIGWTLISVGLLDLPIFYIHAVNIKFNLSKHLDFYIILLRLQAQQDAVNLITHSKTR